MEEDTKLLDTDRDRFLPIEAVPSSVAYEIMCDFVDSLPESKIQLELGRALQQRRPFRRFKDVLLNYPVVQENWFRFHERAFMKIIQKWLDDHGAEVTLVSCHAQL